MRTPKVSVTKSNATADVEKRLADLEQRLASMARAMTSRAQPHDLIISQAAHGLAVGNPVRLSAGAWVKSQADTAANAVVGGIVSAVLSPDLFKLSTGGWIGGLSGLTANAIHYLSAATAGALTTTAPTIAIPVLLADSTTSGVLLSMDVHLPISVGLVNSQSYTSGSGTWTNPGGLSRLLALVIGGGGGANGTGSSSIQGYVATSSGGSPTKAVYIRGRGLGGGGGGSLLVEIDPSVASVTYSVGSGGAGSSTSTASFGGNSTITISGTTLTATGGGAGDSTSFASGSGGLVSPSAGVVGKYNYVLAFNGLTAAPLDNALLGSAVSGLLLVNGAPAATHASYGKGGDPSTSSGGAGANGAGGLVTFWYA